MWNSKPEQNQQKSQEMTWQQFFMALALIAVGILVIAYRKIAYAASLFYFEHFEEIYFALFAAVVALALLGLRKLRKETEPLYDRVQRLKPLWHPWEGIHVASTLDEGTELFLSEKARCGHVQIIGTTGRGKTKSVIMPWIVRDLSAGRSAVLIDGKGDPELVQVLSAAAEHLEPRPKVVVFDLGNPEASCTVNPLACGSPQQITDRLFAAFDFEEPFYKGVQLNITGSVVALIHEVDGDGAATPGVVTMRRLHELLVDTDALMAAIGKSKSEALRAKLLRFTALPVKERDALLMGLTSQLGPFADGEVARLVNGPVEGRPYQNVAELLLQEGGGTLFIALIPTLKYQQLGHQLGRLMMQELGWAVGERASRRGREAPFIPVYLDEFSAFVYSGFENILNKARSSGVALHLSHQSNADLAKVDENFAEIINTNSNVQCILGLNDPRTADFFARHIGTATTEKTTERARRQAFFGGDERTGDLSIRAVEEFRVDPNDLKAATDGRGVLHLPTSKGIVTERVQFTPLSKEDFETERLDLIAW